MDAYDLLLEITREGTVERYSVHGTDTTEVPYEGKIDSASGFSRSVTPGGGLARVGNGSVTLVGIRGNYKNLQVQVYLRNIDTGEQISLLKGYVAEQRRSSGKTTLTLNDALTEVFEQPIQRKTTTALFPNLPDTTPTRLIPIVMGTVSSADFRYQGRIPAYLIDPAISTPYYKYVAAQHPLKSVLAVYRNGEYLDPSYYTVVEEEIDGVTMTFFRFTVDQRESKNSNGEEITYDALGMTDTNLSSGTLLEDPASQLRALLQFQGAVDSSEFDETLYTQAQSDYSSFDSGFVACGESMSWLNAIDAYGNSTCLQMYQTGEGKLALRYDNASGSGTAVAHITDSGFAVKGTFADVTSPDPVSLLNISYAADFAREGHESGDGFVILDDYSSEAEIGRSVTDEISLGLVNGINTALSVGEIKMFYRRPSRKLHQISVFPRTDLDLNDIIELTHHEGTSYDEVLLQARYRIIGLTWTISKRDASVRLNIVDAAEFTATTFSEDEPGRNNSSTLPPALKEWGSTLVFYKVDYNTVAWSAGSNEKLFHPDGPVYTIVAGTTGNMTLGLTYFIYFDYSQYLDALIVTTDASDLAGLHKKLICKCAASPYEDGDPQIEPLYGRAIINTDGIGDGSIENPHIRDGVVTYEKCTIYYLSSLSADIGTITAGSLTAVTITASLIRTSATNPRVEMDSSGLTSYDPNGNARLSISTGLTTPAGISGSYTTNHYYLSDPSADFSDVPEGALVTVFQAGLGTFSATVTSVESSTLLLISSDIPPGYSATYRVSWTEGEAGQLWIATSDTDPGRIIFGNVGMIYSSDSQAQGLGLRFIPQEDSTGYLMIGNIYQVLRWHSVYVHSSRLISLEAYRDEDTYVNAVGGIYDGSSMAEYNIGVLYGKYGGSLILRSVTGNVAFFSIGLGSHSSAFKVRNTNGVLYYTFNGIEYAFPSADGSANQVLSTDGLGGLSWQNAGVGGGAEELNELSDVTLSSISDGQVLTYDSGTGQWVNETPAVGGGGITVGDVKQASASSSVADSVWVTVLNLTGSGYLDVLEGYYTNASSKRRDDVDFEVTIDGGTAQTLSFSELDRHAYLDDTYYANYVRRVIYGGARFESSILVRIRHNDTSGSRTVAGLVQYREDQ